jgi:hypothetical protein
VKLAHALGDSRGERVDRVDRIERDRLDGPVEARHVGAPLGRTQVDRALERSEERPLGALGAEVKDLLDAGDPGARESDRRVRTAGLDVFE